MVVAADDEALRPLVTTDRLREFFAPRSIAVVGASDTSGWARFVVASSLATGFSGPLIPVHPVHETVFGQPAARSLRDLDEPVDLAFIMAPVQAVESVLDDAGAAGVRNAIVLASGYREAGEPGRALEEAMIGRAAAHGITVLGPNCLGFLNVHAGAAPFALTVPPPLLPGPVGIALQSGALASVVLGFARGHAIGVSTLANLDVLAEVITRLGDVAVRLSGTGAGPNGALRALEVNPLWVDGDRVEALDVLVVTSLPSRSRGPGGRRPRPAKPRLTGQPAPVDNFRTQF